MPKADLSGAGRQEEFFGPWGSPQVIEKAQFGEENQRIFLGQIWPNFAGFVPGLAQFGFCLSFLANEATLIRASCA
jgi:hypothetical protein